MSEVRGEALWREYRAGARNFFRLIEFPDHTTVHAGLYVYFTKGSRICNIW